MALTRKAIGPTRASKEWGSVVGRYYDIPPHVRDERIVTLTRSHLR